MAYSNVENQKAYGRQHYLDNKDLYKQRALESKARQKVINKQFVREYLESHPCIDCGNSDIRVLQFDHRDRQDKIASVGRFLSSRKNLEAEIAKCDIRCANCHMIRTAEQFGWSRMVFDEASTKGET